MQKIWSLNSQILSKKTNTGNQDKITKFNTLIESFVSKIDKSIEEFKFNVTVAHFYEVYRVFTKHINLELSKECLILNITKIMKLMIPFTPYLAYECLEKLKCKNINTWPEIKGINLNEIKFAIQVNGKTRDIITIQNNLKEEEIYKIILKSSKAKKFIENKTISKTIFVKDKIVNYIIKS